MSVPISFFCSKIMNGMSQTIVSRRANLFLLLGTSLILGCSLVSRLPTQPVQHTPIPTSKTRIAFVARELGGQKHGIYTVNADGTNLKQVAENGDVPAWSPDAGQIAYNALLQSKFWAVVINSDGTGMQPIIPVGGGVGAYPPSWSPDAQQIAVATNDSRISGSASIRILNLSLHTDIKINCETSQSCFWPDWSSDGRYIAYNYIPQEDSPANLAVVDLEKHTAIQTIQKNAAFFHWQPYTRNLAVTTERDGKQGIFLLSADGSQASLIVEDQRPNDVVWSSDGKRLAFTSIRDANGNGEIYVVNSDGSGLLRLTNDPHLDESPTWSPDGKQIAFSSNRDGHFEIYVVSVDGTKLRRLTNSPTDKFDPVWSPR